MLKIEKVGDGAFVAYTTPPYMKTSVLEKTASMDAMALVEKLVDCGFHPRDVADAIYAADPATFSQIFERKK